MAVVRCVCRDVRFELVIELWQQGMSLDEIQDQTGMGGGCGTCLPYARLAVATGRASLPALSPAQLDRLLVEHAAPTMTDRCEVAAGR